MSQNSYTYSIFLNFAWRTGKVIFYGRADPDADRVEADASPVSAYDRQLINALLDAMKTISRQGQSRFLLIAVPSIKGYSPEEYFNPENLRHLIPINFEKSKIWHVPNGFGHINTAAHRKIADAVYNRLCTF